MEKESALSVGGIVGVLIAILMPCLLIACFWYIAKKKDQYTGVEIQRNMIEEKETNKGVGMMKHNSATTKGENETELLPIHAGLEEEEYAD